MKRKLLWYTIAVIWILIFLAFAAQWTEKKTPKSGALAIAVTEAAPAARDGIRAGPITREVLREYVQLSNYKVYDRLADEIVDASIVAGQQFQLSPVLLLATAGVESGFDLNAVSEKGACGLMQIMPSTWNDQLRQAKVVEKKSDYFDPVKNVLAGAFVLRTYLDESRDFDAALNKYLGVNSEKYRDGIDRALGQMLMRGISKEINKPYSIARMPANMRDLGILQVSEVREPK